MPKSVIYSKRFDESDWMDGFEEKLARNNVYEPGNAMSVDEFLKKVRETKYIPIPERLEWKDYFVQKAIRLSEEESVDVDVFEREYGIEVKFQYDLIAYISRMMKFLAFGDEVTVLSVPKTESRLEISVIYYTHEQYFNGRKVRELRKLPHMEAHCGTTRKDGK